MASIVVAGDTSGAITIAAPAVAGTNTITLPAATGTMLTTASTTGVNASAISTGTLAQAYGGTGTTTGYYSFKNRIINGAMVIDQRNAGASVTQGTGNSYVVDRFLIGGTVTSKFTAQQNAGSVTPPTGFINYLGCTSSSAYSVGASETFNMQQRIEGLNVADLGWGTANAKTVTLSFWVRSSLTGTFGGSLRNSAADRSYPFTYTISAANTWEQKSITVAGDTTGTWLTTSGIGINVTFSLGTGSTLSGTANAWAAGNFPSATGAVSVVGTNGATFYITGVQLEVGSTATSFDYRPYGTELALCQRYYQIIGGTFNSFPLVQAYTVASNNIDIPISFPVSMRTSPTTTVDGTWAASNTGQPQIIYPSTQGFSFRITAVITGALYAYPDSNDDKMTFSAEL